MITLCLEVVGFTIFQSHRIARVALRASIGLLFVVSGVSSAAGQPIRNTNTPLAQAYRDYSEEDGLSNAYVTGFYQDGLGFIWLSTAGGLERFDGYEFRLIPSLAGDSTTLTHKNAWSVDGDRMGHLWIGTSHGVNRYEPTTGVITRFYHNPTDTSSITSNFVRKTLVDSNGDVWIGSDNGLSRYNSKTAKFHRYLFTPGQAQQNVRAIAEDASRNIWFAVRDTLFVYNLDSEALLRPHYALPTPPGESLVIRVMLFDGDSLLWLGTDRAGVYAFDVRSREYVHHIDTSGEANLRLADDQVNALNIDHDGNVWIGTMDGFHLYSPSVHRIYRPSNTDGRVSTSKEIWSLFTDEAGNVWVGSFYGGVRVWLRHAKRFGHFDTTALGGLDANSTIVKAFARSPDGDVLFVVGGSKLMRWHTQEQRASDENISIP